MVYDWRKKVKDLRPAKAWDAEGKKLPGTTFYIDTVTGFCQAFETDRNGCIMFHNGLPSIDRFFVPSPIKVVFNK